MIRSMTGFGKASESYGSKKITVEIRSLNSKQLDLSVRIPSVFKEKEMALRTFVAQHAERGKVDVAVFYENVGEERSYSINKSLALAYYAELRELADQIGVKAEEQVLANLLRMPEVVSSEKREADEKEWASIMRLCGEALDQFSAFRDAEGEKLRVELQSRVDLILRYLEEVEPFEQQRIQLIKDRMQRSLSEHISQENIDTNRFEQELIYYFERLDVNEEKMRLRTHCQYFTETLEKEQHQGRKLGFITQEMGREINTLGSKSNHAGMQKLVVQMKDELEKIKEQVLNVL